LFHAYRKSIVYNLQVNRTTSLAPLADMIIWHDFYFDQCRLRLYFGFYVAIARHTFSSENINTPYV